MPTVQILVRSDADRYHCTVFLNGIRHETFVIGTAMNQRFSQSTTEFTDAPALS